MGGIPDCFLFDFLSAADAHATSESKTIKNRRFDMVVAGEIIV